MWFRSVLLPIARSSVAIFFAVWLGAACAVFFLLPSDSPAWNVRLDFRNGTSINTQAVAQGSAAASGPIEGYRTIVALISNPVFRDTIAKTSPFEAASNVLSKRLIFDTLRAHATDDSTIEIQYTAASAADCLTAYRTIADRILQRHAVLFDQNQKLIQAAIDDYRERSIQLQKWEDAEMQMGPQPSPHEIETRSALGIAWNDTREQLRRLEATKILRTPTYFPPEAEVYVNGPLSNNTVRLSAIAGLSIIFCLFTLAWGLQAWRQKPRNPAQ